MNATSLQQNEKMVYILRSLYDQYGYTRYKMNKFEEYDLYARNKDFLISDSVITFTDTNGKLMALKPDVTLSIVKNTKDSDGVQKLYYNENVYRISKKTRSFREIMQMGLEALGEIDDFCIYEVLQLAAASLQAMEQNAVMEISHLGILSEVIEYTGIPFENHNEILHYIGEKNIHELTSACARWNIPKDRIELLKDIISINGSPDAMLQKLTNRLIGIAKEDTMNRFVRIISALNGCAYSRLLRIDFSVVGDIRYYNGFVFRGFLEGIPSSIISGGQYDVLMRKMGRSSNAIGFAVYLDSLDQRSKNAAFDYDSILLYDDSADFNVIEKLRKEYMAKGESVAVLRKLPDGKSCRRLIRLINGEVEVVEENA